jgi:hypothetical protein
MTWNCVCSSIWHLEHHQRSDGGHRQPTEEQFELRQELLARHGSDLTECG